MHNVNVKDESKLEHSLKNYINIMVNKKVLEETNENNVQLEKKNIEYKTYMRCKICKTDIHQTTDAFRHLGK